jgi:hypothetical protein
MIGAENFSSISLHLLINVGRCLTAAKMKCFDKNLSFPIFLVHKYGHHSSVALNIVLNSQRVVKDEASNQP